MFELVYWSSIPIIAWLTSIYPSDISSIISYSSSYDDGESLALFLEAAKVPFLVAVIFWPNSWLRNGIVVRLARIIISRTAMSVEKEED